MRLSRIDIPPLLSTRFLARPSRRARDAEEMQDKQPGAREVFAPKK